jgi:hypothetical protein
MEMPTGYTADVGEGKITTLRQFALRCARGMGACVTMRDDPFDAAIPDKFKPDLSYHQRERDAAKALLEQVEALSAAECEARAEASYAEQLAYHEKYEAEKNIVNDRYRNMLAAVRDWETEAEGIKDFMIQQLEISISDYSSMPPKRLTGDEWLKSERSDALHSIAYHERSIAEEIHRVEMRNLWLAALRRSLPAE